MHDVGNFRDRLNYAGFVVGEHHGNQRPFGTAERSLEPDEINKPARGHRQFFNLIGSKAATASDGRMFDRRDQQPAARILAAADFDRRRQRQHIGFGGPTRERDVFGFSPDQIGNAAARLFHQAAGGTAFCMYRRCIAGQTQRRRYSVARLVAQRGCRIPVKISPFDHSFRQYLITVFRLDPAKSLLFALGIVVEARNYLALIACVAVGNSGNHIIRIILNYPPGPVKFRRAHNKSRCCRLRHARSEVDSNA